MGCTRDLIKTGIFGAIGSYGIYKAITWRNLFWKFMATGIGAVGMIKALGDGSKAIDSCNIKMLKKMRKKIKR